MSDRRCSVSASGSTDGGGAALPWRGWALPLMAAVVALPASALAGPQGGEVKKGDATISAAGNQTTIDQHSSKAIIEWRSFGLAPHESAVFNQPGSNAIALNRVTGADPSHILGTLRGNGQVWLVNRNGVMFGPSAKVDVQGLVATTADIPDMDFMYGDTYQFSLPSTNPGAGVVNEGTISFGDRGLAALVAGNVRNAGAIEGRLGSVMIAGAPTFTLTLDPRDGGLIRFAATSQVTEALAGQPLVQNSGEIHNDGGLVRLTANAAAGIVDEAINIGGLIEAQSLALRQGRIELVNNAAGGIVVDGRLDVGAGESGAADGIVFMHGDNIAMTGRSTIEGAGNVDLSAHQTMLIDGTVVSSDDITLQAEDMTIAGRVAAAGDVRLRGKNIATAGAGEVSAQRLDVASIAGPHHVQGGGTVSLNTDVDQLAIGKAVPAGTRFRDAVIVNDGDLAVGQIDSSGIDAGRVTLTTNGTLSIDRPVVASGTGDAVVMVTGRFVNNVGADALQTPQGRALVYSNDPRIDDRGNLSGSLLFQRSFADTPPGTVNLPGNVFIYRTDPNPRVPPPPTAAVLPQPTAFEIAQVTQPTVVPAIDIAESSAAGESRLIRLPPVAAADEDPENADLLFANDGNRELWGLGGGR